MTLKFSAGVIILVIALALQFWLASAGLYFDFTFAALISFAFVFDFWELITFVLLAVFIINWRPGVTTEILIFALYPVVVYFLRGIVHWATWLENFAAIFIGFLLLYFIVAHGGFSWKAFGTDTAAGWLFGSLVLFPLYRWGRE